MPNLSLSRPGYSVRRSPGAMAAAVALNGGVLALLVAIPATQTLIQPEQPIRTTWVKLTPPPPPFPEDPKVEPERKPAQTTIAATSTQSDPLVLKPLVPITPDIVAPYTPPQSLPETGLSKEEPRAPVLVAAKPDPRYADAFHPDYPAALRRQGLEGSVTVRITIDERGRVVAVEMVRATNAAFFEETKRQALGEWRFSPATRDGVAVRAEQIMTVHFRLED